MRPKSNRAPPTPPLDPETHSQSTLAFSKFMEPNSSLNSSFSGISRSVYKAIAQSAKLSRSPRDLDLELHFKDLEIRDLKLKLREKQNELIDRQRAQAEELNQAQKFAVLQYKSQEISLKEELQEAIELSRQEKRRLTATLKNFQQRVDETATPELVRRTDQACLLFSSLESELSLLTQENSALKTTEGQYVQTAQRTQWAVTQLQQALYTLFHPSEIARAQPIVSNSTQQALMCTLDTLLALKAQTEQFVGKYLTYCKESRP